MARQYVTRIVLLSRMQYLHDLALVESIPQSRLEAVNERGNLRKFQQEMRRLCQLDATTQQMYTRTVNESEKEDEVAYFQWVVAMAMDY